MKGRDLSRFPRPRVRLRSLLAAVALLASAASVLVPIAKRAYFPDRWNTWIVRTERRPDGATVRVRIRRYPDRDVVHEEVLAGARSHAPGATPRPPIPRPADPSGRDPAARDEGRGPREGRQGATRAGESTDRRSRS